MTPDTPCRHEYIKIYQRRLKGLERRLVSTKAYLPVGFKATDLSHLGEGSYCFCTRCRVRLYPRRTTAEKAAARIALATEKAQAELDAAAAVAAGETAAEHETSQAIDVEELELETVGIQDIEAEGVKLGDEDEFCQLSDDE